MAAVEAEWHPHNPHIVRINEHDRSKISDEQPPLANVLGVPVEGRHPFIKVWELIGLEIHHILQQAYLVSSSICNGRRPQKYCEIEFKLGGNGQM